MLEDRKRLRARSHEVGSRLLEVCCDDLAPTNPRSEDEWERISTFLNVTTRPSLVLGETHSTSDVSVDRSREDLATMASHHLAMLLDSDLMDETFPCYAKPSTAAATSAATSAATTEAATRKA